MTERVISHLMSRLLDHFISGVDIIWGKFWERLAESRRDDAREKSVLDVSGCHLDSLECQFSQFWYS
jgi:hypothetical protein